MGKFKYLIFCKSRIMLNLDYFVVLFARHWLKPKKGKETQFSFHLIWQMLSKWVNTHYTHDMFTHSTYPVFIYLFLPWWETITLLSWAGGEPKQIIKRPNIPPFKFFFQDIFHLSQQKKTTISFWIVYFSFLLVTLQHLKALLKKYPKPYSND